MKLKYLFTVSILPILLLLSIPSKTYSQDRLGVKINFVEQETRELNKLKSSGVTLRTVYAKLAIAGDVKPTKVEEMIFNKKGLPVEKKNFTSTGDVRERTEYKYNAKGFLIKKTIFDGDNVATDVEETKTDKNGRILEIAAQNIVRGVSHKTRRVMSYNKDGLLAETRGYEKGKDFLVKEVCEYKDGLLKAKKSYNIAGYFLGSEECDYDSLKRKIKEYVVNISYEKNKDTLSTNKIKATKEEATFLFKYDSKGNIVEIKSPEYKQVFTFNEKGDFLRDIVYDNIGRKQNDNEFFYGEDGLLKKIIRYYADGSPGAYLDYFYEIKK
jgi:hypothetical protein